MFKMNLNNLYNSTIVFKPALKNSA